MKRPAASVAGGSVERVLERLSVEVRRGWIRCAGICQYLGTTVGEGVGSAGWVDPTEGVDSTGGAGSTEGTGSGG